MSARLRKAISYSLAAGIFGGSLWFPWAEITISPADEIVPFKWISTVAATVFGLITGFLIGACGSISSVPAAEKDPVGKRVSNVRLVLGFCGQFLYRLLIGVVFGFIITAMLNLTVGVGVVIGTHRLPASPALEVVVMACVVALKAPLPGCIFAALTAGRGQPGQKDRLVSWTVLGSAVGMGLAAPLGAAMALAFDAGLINSNERVMPILINGVGGVIGAAGGILVGILSRITLSPPRA